MSINTPTGNMTGQPVSQHGGLPGGTRTPARSTRRTGGVQETKPFYRTSEFITYAVATVVVIIMGYSGKDTMTTYATWQLVTFLTMAYIISRGLAKAGSREGTRDHSDVYPS
jgi:hypothetical protein